MTLEGGSGRATVSSPATLLVKEGKYYARIEWSSPNYDYMKVGTETYYPINSEGNSVFEIPVAEFDKKLSVLADTTAMGTPHEVEYQLTFYRPSLVYEESMELDYAKEFAVDFYRGGYALIQISDGSSFFVVPAGKEVPDDLEKITDGKEKVVILKQPVKNIYLVASATMDMFVSLDAVDDIKLSGQKEDSWQMEEAKKKMAEGKIVYAGKYNMPDYERIVSSDCSLAIESTMILHSPEVMEKLEGFGIPVLIDRSSYEKHPLGRTEWVKLYGVITGKREEAERSFTRQKELLDSIEQEENTGKTVAFFFIMSNGTVNVRKSGDYVPKMIELAGGDYVFSDLGDDTASSSVNMTMEDFYKGAKDADFLIYNSTIAGEVRSVEELLQKSPILKDFKAVKKRNVFCTTKNFYQESMSTGNFIKELHNVLKSGENADEGFTQLYKLE